MKEKTVTSQEFFLDREDVLETLNVTFHKVDNSLQSQFAFVLGEAGMGKTSLVNKFLFSIKSNDIIILTAKGYEEQESPLFPFLEMVKVLLSDYRDFTKGDLLDTILNLAKLVPTLEPYVGAAQEITKTIRGMSDVDRYSVDNSHYAFSNYLAIFQKITRKKTIVLHVEDIQWFDSTSLELLSYLMRKVTSKVMFIMSYRTGFVTSQKELDARKYFETLSKLDRNKSAIIKLDAVPEKLYPNFIQGFLGPHKFSKDVVHLLYKQTNGNPFFLKSLLGLFRESKAATIDNNGYWIISDSLNENVLPENVSEAICKRLGKVYRDLPGARDLLAYASVLGYQFDLDTISNFMRKNKMEIFHLLEDLEKIYSIVKRVGDSTTFVFDHRKTQETIYSGLGVLAVECHREIAKFLENNFGKHKDPFITSYHYYNGHEWEKALKYLELSAETSFDNYFFSNSVKQYEECFQLLKEKRIQISESARILLNIGYARSLLGNNNTSSCITNLNNLLQTFNMSEIQKAETNLLLGRCWRYEGTGDAGKKAVFSLEESLRIYEKLGNVNKLGEVYSFLTTVYDHFGHREKAADAFGKSQINFNLANDAIGLAKLQRKSGIIYESRRAIEFMKNALDAFEKYSMKIEKARCLNNMGAESFYIAKFDDAEKYLGSSLEIFRSLDSPEVDIPLNNIGLVYQQRGDYAKALQFFDDANSNVSELFNEIFVNMNIANVLRQTGDVERARKITVHLEPLVLSYPEGLMNDYYGLNRAAIHYDLGEFDAAQMWLEKFKPHNYKYDDELILAKRYRLLSKILDRKGSSKESAETASKSSEIFKTERLQKWFYELDYYPCDIHLWD